MPPRPRAPVAPAPVEEEPSNVLLPEIDADPRSYLGLAPVETVWRDRAWTLPALPARDWLELIWSEQFEATAIFPGMVEEREEIEEMLEDEFLDDNLDPNELFEIAMEILEVASGYKWWFTIKLCAAAKFSWSRVGGFLVLAGVDASRWTLGAWCSALLAIMTEKAHPKQVAELLEHFNRPPEGYGPSIEESMEMDEAAFMAAMAAPF